ncbi:MAG: hypothetical protein OHK0015_16210 [Chloroflexi bacterium OHK40]
MATRASLIIAGLAVLALWLALLAAPPLRLDVGAGGDGRFLAGFYDAEQGDGASFRWSGPDARLMLHGAPLGPARLEMRLSGERLAAEGTPLVALVGERVTLAAFEVTPGWRRYQLLLPPGAAAGLAGTRPLDLRTAVSQPGAATDGRDYRALGLPLDRLTLTPLTADAGGTLLRALWLSWPIALLGALAGWTAPRPAVRALCAALALLLATWAWRDPHGLAWALPPAPWTLGATTVLAGWRWWAGRDSPPALGPLWGATALATLGLATGLMHARIATGIAAALAAAALLVLARLPSGLGAARAVVPLRPGVPLLALVAILGLALTLRLYRIDDLPFGLWRDEARHGLVALRIAEDPGYRPIFVREERVELPGLGLYPFAAAINIFGVHLWTMRLVTALAGALTVLPLYGVAARLSGHRAVGLVAALLLAVSSWHISLSRFAFPTVFEPLLSLSAWWLLLVGLDRSRAGGEAQRATALPALRSLGACLLAGALLGLAAQTYHTGRITPLAALWLALLLLLREPRAWRGWMAGASAAALGLTLTVAPLAAYAITRPGDFNERVGAVFLLGEEALRAQAPLAALDANLGRHLRMFTVEGDANGRHHAPFRPLLDVISGVGLLAGVAALLRRPDPWPARFLLGALGIGLLPGLLAVDAPHAMRSSGALAPACIIAATGWAELWRILAPSRPTLAWRLAPLILVGGLIGLNAGLYFVVMPRDPQVFGGFYPVQSWMGIYAGRQDGDGRIYVPRTVRDHPSFRFLAAGRPVGVFEGGSAEPPPAPGDRFLLTGYFATEEAAALDASLASTPEATGPPFPDGRGPTYYVVRAR